ncbi:MAG: GNAT family N-acetyltransferase [Oscillospiraceae bacterium]
MLNLEFKEQDYDDAIEELVGTEFRKYAAKNGVVCDYTSFYFVAKQDDAVIGALTGYSYYQEVYIGDLIVLEPYRKMHIGSQLVDAVEHHFKDKGFKHISLCTFHFQALDFYQKHGYQVEFVREDVNNPKLTKYFLIKYFNS